jgi:hypothetical protein
MTVLGLVRTDHLNFHGVHTNALRNVPPSAARDLRRIDRVRNDDAAKPKIILGDGISNQIAFFANGKNLLGTGHRPFDRINAQIDGSH